LTPGTYSTTRMHTATTAGLDVYGDGPRCNSDTGTLIVSEVTVDAHGNPTAFAATYEEHCEGGTPAAFGELRYNSTFDFAAAQTTPSFLSFPNQIIGRTSSPLSVMVTNLGTVRLNPGSASIDGANAGDFAKQGY